MKYIVGDIFKSFCDMKYAIPFSALKETSLSLGKYILGQGLIQSEINELFERKIIINNYFERVDLSLTHKHKSKNSLIVNFHSQDKLRFISSMYINGDNDLLMDHITGMHIPGIVLIEAAREFFIVSLSYMGFGSYRFILDNVKSVFNSYVFPVETDLSIDIKCLEDSNQKKIFEATINFHQYKNKCAVCCISATLLPEKLAMFSEKISAQNTQLLGRGYVQKY